MSNINLLNMYFITNRGKDIKIEVLEEADGKFPRAAALKNIDAFVNDMEKTKFIESGIFEHTLLYINNKDCHTIDVAVYEHMLNNILDNIDPQKLNNTVLLEKIKKDFSQEDLCLIAFLSPQQIFNEKWEKEIKKKEIREYKEKNMAATDLFKCNRCGERKCKITPLQTRSIDEPTTYFVACLVCNKTFKTQ